MRICLLAYRGNPYSGGQGVYLYHLSRQLAHLGHQVEVIVGPPYPRPLGGWARVHYVPNFNLWGAYRRQWLPRQRPLALLQPWHLFDFAATRLRFFSEPLSFSLRALLLLSRLLRQRRFDLLHDVQTLGYGTWMMRAFGLPLLTTVHHPLTIDQRAAFAGDRGFWEQYHTAVFYPVRMQGFVIRRVDRVITGSEAGRIAIQNDFEVPLERISVVPNGLDTACFHNPGCWQRDPATLLFVGNTDDVKKGAIYLLQALQRLPSRLKLRIVDAPYPIKKLIPEAVERLGLSDRVTFTGKLSDAHLREEYCRCTLLVQPSLYEGFGLPAAEALACGTPVVATDVGAVAEVISPATGLLVPPRDPERLTEAIATLLDDAPRRLAMGAAGRERMVTRFSWPVAARNTVRVYEQMLNRTSILPLPSPLTRGCRNGGQDG
jgi:glycosyltransferase involved in cell wall biosynthesis